MGIMAAIDHRHSCYLLAYNFCSSNEIMNHILYLEATLEPHLYPYGGREKNTGTYSTVIARLLWDCAA